MHFLAEDMAFDRDAVRGSIRQRAPGAGSGRGQGRLLAGQRPVASAGFGRGQPSKVATFGRGAKKGGLMAGESGPC